MKCLKNVKTGTIIRVEDSQANNMVGITWTYVSKSEWRGNNRKKEETVDVAHDMGGSYEVKKTKTKKK